MGSWQCYAQRQEEGKWDERIDPALADQALFEVRTALEHGPKNVRAHEHHVQCLYGLRKIGPAIAAVKALLAVDPHSKYGKRMDARFKGVESLCALGDDEVDNMDDDEALGAFEAAAELAATSKDRDKIELAFCKLSIQRQAMDLTEGGTSKAMQAAMRGSPVVLSGRGGDWTFAGEGQLERERKGRKGVQESGADELNQLSELVDSC